MRTRGERKYRYYEPLRRLMKILYILAWAPGSQTIDEISSALVPYRVDASVAVLRQDLATLHRMGILRRRRRVGRGGDLCRQPYEYRLNAQWARVMEGLDPDN